MLTDETNSNTSTAFESACLPIGCAVSAKYRGAFCSAQVKTVDRQVKIKVTLCDTSDTIIISEEQIIQPVSLRIGNRVFIRLPSSTTSIPTNSRNSLSSSSSLINSSSDNHYDKKQGTIKQIYDNSIYTVVFNDGDEKSLRRSSICLQGIRLYQTQMGQEKFFEDIPTPPPPPPPSASASSSFSTIDLKNSDDLTPIVAIHRHGNNNQHAFPALILKRKSLADYIWIKSFLDGREYIVHKHNDVQSYTNNSYIQNLCRLTSKQATRACEKFIKYNQIPIIWQKKKKNKQINNEQYSTNDSNAIDSDVDNSDDEITEEKDSFVAQLFAFMDDRGTPINNLPKIHNYDLDLHRLFKIVRTLGGSNKVTKNDQWSKVYVKMGLPDESSPKNGRLIENAYKKYLFGYEDLSKKLGTMNTPNAYFGGRTSMSSDSRRSLIRARQQSEEKRVMPVKQYARKRLSVDSKPSLLSTKIQSNTSRRKPIVIKQSSTSTSESSDTSDDETIINNNNKVKKQQPINSKRIISTIKKSSIISDEKKKTSSSSTELRSNSAPVKKSKSTTDADDTMKPVIKIPKITYEILMQSTLTVQKHSKKQDNISNEQQSNALQSSETNKESIVDDITPLPVTPVSPSPPPSIKEEPSSIDTKTETSSIFQSIMPSQQINENDHLNNKRTYENLDDEQVLPAKRSRHSLSSQDSNRNSRLIYDDILINDILLVKLDFNQKKQYSAKCIEKNPSKKQFFVHYIGLDSKYNEWIDFDRIIQRLDEIDSNEDERSPSIISNEEIRISSNDQDNVWKSLLNEETYSTKNTENLTLTSSALRFEPIINYKSTRKINNEDIQSTSNIFQPVSPTKEEILENFSTPSQSTSLCSESITPYSLSISRPTSPSDNRRSSTRPQRRRPFRDSKDSSNATKKRTRLDIDLNSNSIIDHMNNGDNSPILIEQQQSVEIKRRTVGKRTCKRTVNQPDNENEDFHINSPVNITLRQQLEDMFKNRTSRYNFLDLNNNLTGEHRLAHLKDRMRQCQRVFFNLKSALTKIEKQRRLFLRRQKLSITSTTTTTNDLLLSSTCT